MHKLVAPQHSGPHDSIYYTTWYDPTDLFVLPFHAHDIAEDSSTSARSLRSLAASTSSRAHASGSASEYARLRAEVVDLAHSAGVSGASVEDLRRAIRTLRSTSEDVCVSICDRVTQLNTIAKDATAADWRTWKNQWACAYDGKVHGSFRAATDALDDMKQGVIWQSSFKWFVSDTPATCAPIDPIFGSTMHATFGALPGYDSPDLRPATTVQLLEAEDVFGSLGRSEFRAEKALVDSGCGKGLALQKNAFYFCREPDTSLHPTMVSMRGVGSQFDTLSGMASFAPLHVDAASRVTSCVKPVDVILMPVELRPYSIVGRTALSFSTLTLHQGSVPVFSEPQPQADTN